MKRSANRLWWYPRSRKSRPGTRLCSLFGELPGRGSGLLLRGWSRLRLGLFFLRRRQDGVQNGAFHAGHELHRPGIADVLNQPVDDFVSKFAMRHLAAAEAEAGLHLVAVIQETHGLVLLGLVVV